MQGTDRIDPYKDYIRRLLRAKGLDTLQTEPLVYRKEGELICSEKYARAAGETVLFMQW